MSAALRAPNTSARSTHAGQGRVVVNRNADAVDIETQIEAVLATRTLWDLAAQVPPQATGAPRKLPTVLYCAMLGLQAVFGSFRKVEANLRKVTTDEGTVLWSLLCELTVRYQAVYRPDDPPIDLELLQATRPLTAQNFFDARADWLAPYMHLLEAAFEASADETATEIGYADADGEGSINNLVRERVAAGDGKVVRAPGTRYRLLSAEQLRELRKQNRRLTPDQCVLDTRTGEVMAAREMIGEQLYKTGAGLKIGYKYTSVDIRDDHPNSTVVLRLRRQSTTHEAQEMTDAAIDVKEKLPGLLGFVVDTALRGEHHRQLMRHGIVGISPVAAASVADDGARTEKAGLVAERPHDHPHDFECTHAYYFHGGQVGEYRLLADGSSVFEPLGDPHVEVRPDKGGARMYATFALTCAEALGDGEAPIGFGTLRLNLTQEAPAGKGGLNYAENVRLVPPGGARYKRTYGWRENSENSNRQRDDEKWGARARSWTATRQHWNEIGGAMVQNGIAVLLHRHRVANGTVTTVTRHNRKRRTEAPAEEISPIATATAA